MSVPAQTLLDNVETAINGILTALVTANVLEYQLPDGRRIKRNDFGPMLDSLRAARTELKREIAFKTRSPVRVGKLGRRRPVDRQ